MNSLKTKLAHLKKRYEHMVYVNFMHVFPYYDTERVAMLAKKIKKMESTKEDYDNEPVVACRHCKSLNIRMDSLGNNICFKCGSANELETYDTIHEYNKQVNQDERSE